MANRLFCQTASRLIKCNRKTWAIPKICAQSSKKSTNFDSSWMQVRFSTSNQQEVQHSDIETITSATNSINTTDRNNQDFFDLNDLFSIEDLITARVHLGHRIELLEPHMRPYIFGQRLGVAIIDLDETVRMLKTALNVAAEIAYRGGIILFVHKPGQSGPMVEQAAKDCGEFAYCRKWLDSVFANSTRTYGAITRLPDLCIVFSAVNLDRPHKAIQMSAKLLIPTIGIVDTNANPTLITYPVPGNDDSPESIELYAHLFKTAILRGKEKRNMEILAKSNEQTHNPNPEIGGEEWWAKQNEAS